MIIRDVIEADTEALIKLGEGFHGRCNFKNYNINHDRISFILKELISYDDVFSKAAWHGDKPIAMLFGEIVQDLSIDVFTARTCLMYGEGPGLAPALALRKLVRMFEDWSRSRGANFMYLDITGGVDDEKCALLFSRSGFRQAGHPLMKEL